MPNLSSPATADPGSSPRTGEPAQPRAVGIGELVWDLLPTGPRLGGAPFNVVANLVRLGWQSRYVTAVGDDDLGHRARRRMGELGVDASLVQTADAPTGTVRVELDASGAPAFEIVSPAAYESVRSVELTERATLDAIVFGTLAQRFGGVLDATVQLAAAAPASIRLYDVNLREGCWEAGLIHRLIQLATIVKVNEDEAATVSHELSLGSDSVEGFCRTLCERFGLRATAVTRGADGAGILLDGRYHHMPASPVRVVDTVGAGDAFAAGLIAGIQRNWPGERVLDLALRVASVVASREGPTPEWDAAELNIADAASVGDTEITAPAHRAST